jgi:hypothetical protein
MTSLTFSFRKSTLSLFAVSVATLASASLAAAPFPKEGTGTWVNCFVGEGTFMAASKDRTFGSIYNNGLRFTLTEGALGDASAMDCIFQASIDGKGISGPGFCVSVDADGDKMSLDVTDNNGSGTWKFLGGTGKYAGITGGGEYKPLRKFPAMMQQAKLGGCSNATGTYKLP